MLLSTLALLAIRLDPWIVFAIFATLTVVYAARGYRIKIRDPSERESYFNSLAFSTFLAFLACFALPKDVVYAPIFLLFIHELRKNAVWNLVFYTAGSLFYFTAFYLLTPAPLDVSHVFFISLAGSLSASLIESVDTDADRRLTLLITLSTVFTIFKLYIPSASLTDLALAFFVSLIISFFALRAGVADESGLMSATLVGTTLILFTNFRFFALLLLFYALGSAITKYKYSVKLERGIAEQAGGARGYANVFGNSLAPLFFAIQYGATSNKIFAAAFVAAVATALADTMASEVGKASDRVYLITNFRRVKPGISGGVSVKGEIACLAGVAITAALALALQIVDLNVAVIAAVTAFLGVHIDSVLGATLEEKGYLTNSAVNFLATLSSGILCFAILALLSSSAC